MLVLEKQGCPQLYQTRLDVGMNFIPYGSRDHSSYPNSLTLNFEEDYKLPRPTFLLPSSFNPLLQTVGVHNQTE